MRTLDPEANTIVAVRKGDRGRIEMVKMTDGTIMSVEDAIPLAGGHSIPGFTVGRNRYGEATLRSMPDKSDANNLANMPQF